ncbi:hypothetical protein C1141_19960, partial [Vibrio agarivorans]
MKKSIIKISSFAIILIFTVIGFKIYTTDRTAKSRGDGLFWKEVEYVAVGDNYTTPRDYEILAEDQNGSNVIGFGGDNKHTYLMVDSFLDQRLFVREDYIPNNNGPLTAVAIRRDLIKSI